MKKTAKKKSKVAQVVLRRGRIENQPTTKPVLRHAQIGSRLPKPVVPICEFCSERAEYLAAQSDDGGKEVEWARICKGHAEGWNLASDWDAPVFKLGDKSEEFRCPHLVRWNSVRYSEGTATPMEAIAEVECAKCGRLGDIALHDEDVRWTFEE